MRIVIIGGVAGGAGAAAAARRSNESAEIAVFEAGPHISFANCGLPYYLSGEIESRERLLVTSPTLMKQRFNIDVHMNHQVTSIDRAGKSVRIRNLRTGTEFDRPYDRLVIATGARAIRPPTPGIDHPRISECRTIDDIDKLSELTQRHPAGRALVIGGGFIGIEVAEALVKRGLSVTLLDLAPQILPPLDPEIAAAGQEQLIKHGVTLKLGTKAERFEHSADSSTAILSDGQCVPFDFAVLSIGVTPETSLAKAAGLTLGNTGGIAVDQHQRTSDPDIFAAGDVTELVYWPTGTRMKIALAGPANKQARVAGANAACTGPAALKTTGAAGTSIVRVFDLAIGMTGLSEKAAIAQKIPYQVVYTQNAHHAGYFPGAKPLFIKLLFSPANGRVLGGQIFGPEGADKRLDVLATAIQGKFTVDDLTDVDLTYAPPFGSAKDPVVIAAMVAANALHGRTTLITPRQLAAELAAESKPFVLDVRTPREYASGKIDGGINIPLESLRENHAQVPHDRPVVVHCAVGYRGYVAERILKQLGYTNIRNLTGGYRSWQLSQPSK